MTKKSKTTTHNEIQPAKNIFTDVFLFLLQCYFENLNVVSTVKLQGLFNGEKKVNGVFYVHHETVGRKHTQ